MARRSNRTLVPQARQALHQMKYEIANELQIPTNLIQGDYWGNLSSRDCGSVGGSMVKRMIQAAEQSLVQGTAAGVRLGFQQTLNPGFQQNMHQTHQFQFGHQGGFTSPQFHTNVSPTTGPTS